MKETQKIDCLEFRRLSLIEPNSQASDFLRHTEDCPSCLRFVQSVQEMDQSLQSSTHVVASDALKARLKLAQGIRQRPRESQPQWLRPAALAAALAVVALGVGTVISLQQLPSEPMLASTIADQSTQAEMFSGVLHHVGHHPEQAAWEAQNANAIVNTLLADYDQRLRFNFLENLTFGEICPMGDYIGLHATLETSNGPVTIAYFKGYMLDRAEDFTQSNYVARVKPVSGGSMVIMGESLDKVNLAERQLDAVMVWKI